MISYLRSSADGDEDVLLIGDEFSDGFVIEDVDESIRSSAGREVGCNLAEVTGDRLQHPEIRFSLGRSEVGSGLTILNGIHTSG